MNHPARRHWQATVVVVLALCCGCRHAATPVIKTSAAAIGGTIAGIVEASGATVALEGRTVAAVNVSTGERYETTTGLNGGYTINVPRGTYRLEVEVRSGETLAQQPDATRVTHGGLDAGRDFNVASPATAPD